MPQVSIYLHKSISDSVEIIASAVDTSRSEIIEDCLRYILDNDLEEAVWGDRYTEGLKALEELAEEIEEAEEEAEEEPEEEE